MTPHDQQYSIAPSAEYNHTTASYDANTNAIRV